MKNESNFEVIKIEDAQKSGYVVIYVKFEGNDKVYNFIRKTVKSGKYNRRSVIDGFLIHYEEVTLSQEKYRVIEIEKEYDTLGKKKIGKVSDKIKDEIETKGIKTELPKVEIKKGPVHHAKYEDIKTCLECGIPVYLAGPAGSGKNHTVEQIAKELGWNFYFSNSVQQEYKLTGFIDAGGDFHETEFYKACTDEKECVFFLDEMDASIPEVLVLLNAAIANGYFEFPNGRVNFDHVHFVAAGNTVGSGADEMYTGRMVLDQATLDRFAIIEFDYDLGIENAITKGNTDLINFIHDMRKVAEQNGIRATYSYRCMTMVTKLEKSNMKLSVILKMTVFKGMDKDTINTIPSTGNSKYYKALDEIKKAA